MPSRPGKALKNHTLKNDAKLVEIHVVNLGVAVVHDWAKQHVLKLRRVDVLADDLPRRNAAPPATTRRQMRSTRALKPAA